MNYETLLYDTEGPIATITVNRPERLITIVPPTSSSHSDRVQTAGWPRH